MGNIDIDNVSNAGSETGEISRQVAPLVKNATEQLLGEDEGEEEEAISTGADGVGGSVAGDVESGPDVSRTS